MMLDTSRVQAPPPLRRRRGAGPVASVQLARMLTLALAILTAGLAPSRADAPRRIVSLNVCLDAIVLDLVGRDRIAALTTLAADATLSTVADRVQGMTLVRGTAEEVLALDPDLVLAGPWTTGPTVDLLRRLGRRIEIVPVATSIDGVRTTIAAVASAVGEDARGRVMVAAFDQRLAVIQSRVAAHAARRGPSAIALHVNGLVSGPGTLLDEALSRAGYRNAADELPLKRGGRLELETIVAAPPDLIVFGDSSTAYRTVAADNLRHPALARVLRSKASVILPQPTWLCGTPAIADAIERLWAVRP